MEEFKHPFRKESGGIHKEAEKKKMTKTGNKWLRHAAAILARRSATDPLGLVVQEEGTTLLPISMNLFYDEKRIEK